MLWTGGPAPRLERGLDVIVEDGVLVALEPSYRGRTDVEIDAENCLVLPGFINSHTHAGSSPIGRGVAEDVDLPAGGAFYHATVPITKLAEALSHEELAAVIEWDAIAMLLGGATTIVEESFRGADVWVDVAGRLGVRSWIGLTYPGNVGAIGYMRDGAIVRDEADVELGFRAAVAFHGAHHGSCEGRLSVHLSPHASDTVPEEILRATRRTASELGVGIHLHLAQHLSETQAIARSRNGQSPVRYLEEIGFLGPDVLATHVTYTDADDWDAFARTGANVVHCPYRKAKEGLTSPFYEYLSRGVNVALATDSFSHDLIEDVRLAAVLGKVREGAVGRPRAEQVLSCATWGAARALGRPDLGRLDPGARGDILCVDLTSPFTAPVLDPLRALVYYGRAGGVRHSLVDGRSVVREGTVVGVDLPALRRRVGGASARLWALARDQGLLPETEQA